MGDVPNRYTHTWKPNLLIALLLAPLSVGLAVAGFLEETPWLIRVLLCGMSLLALLAGLGALITISVSVDADGGFELRRRIAWLQLSTHRFKPGELSCVEFDRGGPVTSLSAVTGTSTPTKPRFRIDVRHTNGTFFVTASSDGTDLKTQATSLANALGCPMKRVGSWPK